MTYHPIAYFITDHGFGHATRSLAIMNSLEKRMPQARFEIFTTCPEWLFEELPQSHYSYHRLRTDIGMVQTSPWNEDPDATWRQLNGWLPFDSARVDAIARDLEALNCRLVVNDISPLGIMAGKHAGLPTLLVENFTWDWIYRAYQHTTPELNTAIDYLAEVFNKVDHRIQTQPLCRPKADAVQVPPISRKPRSNREHIREQLQLTDRTKLVLISTGGIPNNFDVINHLPETLDVYFVIPGAQGPLTAHRRVIQLPAHSNFYHPDLVQAADVIIGKVGYSTVAETYQCGTPFGYVLRPVSPESDKLEIFIQSHMPAKAIDHKAFQSGRWLAALPELFEIPRHPNPTQNGADTVATFIQKTFFPNPNDIG